MYNAYPTKMGGMRQSSHCERPGKGQPPVWLPSQSLPLGPRQVVHFGHGLDKEALRESAICREGVEKDNFLKGQKKVKGWNTLAKRKGVKCLGLYLFHLEKKTADTIKFYKIINGMEGLVRDKLFALSHKTRAGELQSDIDWQEVQGSGWTKGTTSQHTEHNQCV